MKFSKSLFLAFAGLGLFACSNEDVTDGNGIANGDANVFVTVQQPTLGSRALDQDGIIDGTVAEVKDMSVVLTAGGIDHTQNFTDVTLGGENQDTKVVNFNKVGVPTNLTVSVNGGAENLTLTSDIINSGKAAPMWGKTTSGNDFKQDPAKKTDYTVAVTPNFQVARLELSGIKHDKKGETGEKPCVFTELKLQGIYLNGILKSNNSEDAQNKLTYKGVDAWTNVQKEKSLPIWNEITPSVDLLNGTQIYPNNNKVIAYNFIPSQTSAQESVVLVLSGKQAGDPVAKTYYATVTKYKYAKTDSKSDAEYIDKFEVGKVYKITDLSFPDEAITEKPEDPKNINVVATITIKSWDAVNTEVEW